MSDAITSGASAEGHERRLLRADLGRRERDLAASARSTAAGTPTARSPARDIKYAFVGNPDRCPVACAAQTTGPNGNAGADGMASIIAHELEEAVTDPDLNAWYDTPRRTRTPTSAPGRSAPPTRLQRRAGQHEARRPRLPDPAELGQRERRLLRAVVAVRLCCRSCDHAASAQTCLVTIEFPPPETIWKPL